MNEDSPLNDFDRSQDRENMPCWLKILENWDAFYSFGFATSKPSRYNELKELVRKGIPNCLRGRVWYQLLGLKELKQRNAKLYEISLNTKLRHEDEHQIKLDLERSFPTSRFFKDRNSVNLESLQRVLHAITIYDEEVGYVQGMSYIGGGLLMYLEEEDVFFALVRLLHLSPFNLIGLYAEGLPLLDKYLHITNKLLEKNSSKVLKKLGEQRNLIDTVFIGWYLSLFVYHFKWSTTLRIWDCLFLEGVKILFRIAISMVNLSYNVLDSVEEHSRLELIQKTLPATINADELLREAFEIHLSKKHIQNYSNEFDDKAFNDGSWNENWELLQMPIFN
eukprot:TRINITY_DN1805_c0_g1_i1.p1 TRINITY_DN1805_c0_g1~~TRINITY_DN1805_c0_g1_i1.p1  ORF type:complete len:389 (+),score=82.16 TRINITY_DN1805_c0_g1_i1:163-1167(+)